MKITYLRKEQNTAIARMEARGFVHITDSASGIVMQRLNDDGFREKVTIDRTGRIRWYKPTRAGIRDKQRLRHVSDKYSHLNIK